MSDSEEARASIQKPKGLYEATAQAYPKYFEHFYVWGGQQVPLSDLVSTVDNSYPNVATYKKVNIFSHVGTSTTGDPIWQQLYLPVYDSDFSEDGWTEKIPFTSSDQFHLYNNSEKFPDAVKAGTRPSFKKLLWAINNDDPNTFGETFTYDTLTYTLSASKTQLVLKEISSGYTSILTSDNFTDQTIPSSLIIVIQGAGGSGSQTFSTSRGTQHGAGGGSGGIASIVVKIDSSSTTLTEVIRIVVAGSTAAFDHAGGDTTLTCTYKGVNTTLFVPGGSCPSSSTGGLAGNRATYTVSNTTSPNSWFLGSLPGEAGGSGGATTYQSGISTAGGKVFSTRAPEYTDYFAEYPAGVYLAVGNFAGGAGLMGNTGGAGGAASYFASGGGHTADDTDHLASKGSGGMGSTNINRSKGGAAWVGIYY